MEKLTIAKNGQWTLHKANPPAGGSSGSSGNIPAPPKDADVPGNKPFHSFSAATAEGRLREDRGTRGMLHNFGAGKRPKPEGVKSKRNWGKPAREVDSVYSDVDPGAGMQ